MGFAKLSGALLVCHHGGPVPAPAPVVRHLPSPRVEPPRRDAEAMRRLAHHLKALRLPMFLGEYDKLAQQCGADGEDYCGYLLRLAELELSERKRRSVERRIKAARFPVIKSLDTFDFARIAEHNWRPLAELARGDFIARRENVVAIGPGGSGKTHLAIGLGLVGCRMGWSVGFAGAAALVDELLKARSSHGLPQLQQRLAGYRLLIVDELGHAELPADGAELLFQLLSERCERAATIVTSGLPPAEWPGVLGEPLADTVLNRLARRGHLLDLG